MHLELQPTMQRDLDFLCFSKAIFNLAKDVYLIFDILK